MMIMMQRLWIGGALNNVNCLKSVKRSWCICEHANAERFLDGKRCAKMEMLRKRVMRICVCSSFSLYALVWVWWLHFWFPIKYESSFFHRMLKYFGTHVRWICFLVCVYVYVIMIETCALLHEYWEKKNKKKNNLIRFPTQVHCAWVGSLPRQNYRLNILSAERSTAQHRTGQRYMYNFMQVYVFFSPSYWHTSHFDIHFPMLYECVLYIK